MSYLIPIICSIITSTIITIVWVYFIDQSNKILEQDKKENK